MAQEDPNRFAEWLLIVRKNWPIMHEHFNEWVEDVREEPILLWETKAIRYAVYGLGLIVIVWILSLGANMMTPPLPANATAAAITADFHVVCRDPECNRHFVIHRAMKFNKFPVECPQCQRLTGVKAWRCSSADCKGRWVAPDHREGALSCPICGKKFQ